MAKRSEIDPSSHAHNAERHVSMRTRLVLLLLIMAVPFATLSFLEARNIGERKNAQDTADSLQLAQAVAFNIDDYFRATRELLITVSAEECVRTLDYDAANTWFQEIWPQFSCACNLIQVDSSGDIQVAGRASTDPNKVVNVAETAYFVRAVDSTDLTVGDFMIGKLSGSPSVHLCYPVEDAGGEQVGFVAAPVNLERVYERIAVKDLPAHAIVTVVDDQGIILARSRDNEEWVGKDVSEQLTPDMLEDLTETPKVMKCLDDDNYMIGATRCANAPWWVLVGLDRAVTESEVRSELTKHATLFLPIIAVAVAGWLWAGVDVDRLHRRTEHLSLIDPLTGLWNFRKLDADFERELAHAERYEEPLACAMLDIDHFKEFNDEHGHVMGDKALAWVADRIREGVRDVDSVYRYGGEEFCILLPQTDREGARHVAERVRRRLEREVFLDGDVDGRGRLTISIGISIMPEDGVTRAELVECADEALYRAKRRGRNRVESECPGTGADEEAEG